MDRKEPKSWIKKARIFEVGLSLLLVGIMVLLYFLGRGQNLPEKSFQAKATLELPGRVFISRLENGSLRLFLTGTDLKYFQDQEQAFLFSPVATIQDERGEVLVEAEKGRYYHQEAKVQLSEGVVITHQEYQALTSSLNYDLKSEIAESEAEIQIQGKGLDLKGKGYQFDLKKGEMVLRSEVKGKFKKINEKEQTKK